MAPLALSFGYGLIFATIITLILVPCFYHIAEDIKGGASKLLGKFGITMDSTLYECPEPNVPGIEPETEKKTKETKPRKKGTKKE